MEKEQNDNPLANANIITPCNVCVFAHYEGDTQTGCKAGMLERLEKNGGEIIEAEDTTRKFYIIKDRVCLMRRVAAWKEKFPDKTIDDLLKIAKLEVEINATAEAVIYVDTDDRNAIYRTIDSIYAEKVQPNRISFVLNANLKPGKLVAIIKSYEHKLPWKIEALLDKKLKDRDALDIYLKTKTIYPYFATFHAGKSIQPGIFNDLKERLIDKMEKVMFLPGDGFHNEIVNSQIYKFLHGNTELEIGQKIKGLMNEQA